MDAHDLLTTRASNPKLGAPEPDAETLALAFEAAVRAPDHAQLRPYRFFLVRGQARERLGELIADDLLAKNPAASEELLAKARTKPLRAPLLIVVAAALQDHPKVPRIEQVVCAGAAAQNILLCLHARGFAGIWRTGDPAYSNRIKRAFGLEEGDSIVGFIYAGTATRDAPALKRPVPDDHVSEWTGPCTR